VLFFFAASFFISSLSPRPAKNARYAPRRSAIWQTNFQIDFAVGFCGKFASILMISKDVTLAGFVIAEGSSSGWNVS
jgi:hypothetical protein